LFKALAVAALAIWPLVPITWLQIHSRPEFWRKLGERTYALILSEWLAVAFVAITFQRFLLGVQLNFGVASWPGVPLFLAGVGLNIWTGRLMGPKALVGYPELKPEERPGRLVIAGPFAVVRHPTYLAHLVILLGVFLITNYTGAGLLALLDFFISYFLIVPLEERELLNRFGDDYRMYRNRVPKFFPIRAP
jgi:protein-S-isoprenylcysteine O-methyltransferase Ste14